MPADTAITYGNSLASYGAVTKIFHWLTALLILAAIPLGLVANWWPYDTSDQLAVKAVLFSMHKTVGVLAFLVALGRIAWALTQPKPGLLNADKKLESALAETVHWVLYASLVLVPLSGWIHHAATTGFAPLWLPFGDSLPLVPKSDAVADFFKYWHLIFTKVLALSIALHIAGALKHHLIDRDDTLRRMLPGVTAPPVPPQHHDPLPAYAAAGIWGAAMVLASVIALASTPATAIRGPELAQAPTGWAVQDGTLAISVTQMGSVVEGAFDTWTAAINFDPEAEGPVMGDVRVEIAIPSLTLGSVTTQALGAEFFAAQEHPTAVFAAPITRREDGADTPYLAEGLLTLKGTEAPVTLPFDLTLDGDTATMQGATTLDRRTFGIGTTSYNDETSVRFPVDVTVTLTATRTDGTLPPES